MEYENRVLLGDCLEILRQLPSDTYDSCVTDVPYGLGNKEPKPDELLAFLGGDRLSVGGDFMGKDWEIPTVEVWKEVYRVLKPGGHVLSFGGTRTWDLISMGLRMAGFVKRDTIADEHPGIQWLQSQGMPKTHNIGKAIDKAAGAKRTEVVGVKPGHEDFIGRDNDSSVVALAETGNHAGGFSRPWMKDPEAVERYHTQYAPATEEAALWEGWGTGLKPTWEPIVVFRKPFKGTVANNVLKYGTGAIHIDACRVKHASKEDFEQHKAQVEEVKRKGGVREGSWKNSSDLSGASDVTEAGRWPTNTVFEHTPECERLGTKKVKPQAGSHGFPGGSTTKKYPSRDQVYEAAGDKTISSPIGEDGLEEVEAWQCASVRYLTWARLPDNTTFCLEQASLDVWKGVLNYLLSLLGHPFDNHTEGIENKQESGLGRDAFCPTPSDSPDGCLAYSRSGDALLHLIEEAGQASPQQLAGALEHVLDLVYLRERTRDYQGSARPSNLDGSPLSGGQPNTSWSKTWPQKTLSSSGERVSHTEHKGPQELLIDEQRDSSLVSSIDKAFDGGHENTFDSVDIGVEFLSVLVASMNAASAWLPLPLTVQVYKRVCPVAALDNQTGDRPSTLTGRAAPDQRHKHPGSETNPNSTFLGERTYHSGVYADEGGASRFYPQFEQELAEPFFYTGKATKKEATLDGEVDNVHPTRKPVKLMRWLVRLVNRKGGLVLDPYCGSGSTLVAAEEEGMRWTGIERDPPMHATAEQRVGIVRENLEEVRGDHSAFDGFFGDDDDD